MGTRSESRGQLLTTDFILSLAIFLAMLLASMNLWNAIDTQIRDAEARRDMQAITTYVSDSLVRNQGVPKDWNKDNVLAIGLAKEEHVLDLNKILELKRMNYSNASTLLRLANYNFYVWITDGGGYDLTTGIVRSPVAVIVHDKDHLTYANMLNNSVVTWDMYWDDGLNIGQLLVNTYTQRHNYGSDSRVASLVKLMGNESSYRTIIIDNLWVSDGETDTTALKNFVKRGGILIYTDGNTPFDTPLIAGMGESIVGAGGDPAIVNQTKPVLINLSAGDSISYSLGLPTRRIFNDPTNSDLPLNCIVNGSVTHVKCYVAWWDYGLGRIFYIDNPEHARIGVTTNSLLPYLNIVGENLTMGIKYKNTTADAITVKRMVMISGFEREIANLNLVVWR